MRVVNNLTKPGDIRRVDLNTDTVRIQLFDRADRIYRLVPITGEGGSYGYGSGTETGITRTSGVAPETP
jgi:hypothetical protein